MAEEKIKAIRPQKGFQEDFLSSKADIVIGGGAAGSGKTFAELMEAIRNTNNSKFGAVFFRRTYSQIKNTGGLWDESKNIYPALGAKSNETNLEWTFPSGATVKFNHLQYEKDIYTHQGAQYPLIIFDELTHFTETQFFYLLSRNRSTCGVRPYIRCTTNPDPDSFVAKLIDWWIDQETGLPIPERAGVIRYFIRDKGSMIWGMSKQEVIEQAPFIFENFDKEINPDDLIKSITFIPGSIYDNKEMLKLDPGYLANLLSQDEDIKSRLLDGNWKIKLDDKALFNYDRINDVFSNYTNLLKGNYITCDAARFGRDFNVIMVWRGWEVVNISVMTKSDIHDILKEIESLRKRFLVPKSNTLVDQDGIGGNAVKMGQYKGFSGGATPKKIQGLKENYKNLKTQCYYLAAEKVNMGDISIQLNFENCTVDGIRTTKIKIGSNVVDIRDLIKADLRSIKRANIDNDGKMQINTKEEQKIILCRSPDFADTIMMRSSFDLMPQSQYL